MSKFQPTLTERLQALYVAGEDWAQEALEAVEAVDGAYEAIDMMDDLRRLLELGEHCDALVILAEVEKRLREIDDLKIERDRLTERVDDLESDLESF
jgi:ubiquinone biosynthesis protein UbiJ